MSMGFHHFDLSISGDEVSQYHVQVAIAATHARALSLDTTDWSCILKLYDQLFAITTSPVVALNRVVAVAKVRGAQQALETMEPLAWDARIHGYYLLLAVWGHLFLDLGRREDAAHCWRAALECRCSEPERRFLKRKLLETEQGT